jgi:hypothetical protein
MVSIKVFGKTRSGAKNSRIGNTLRKDFENVFENLGVVNTPLKAFQMFFYKHGAGLGSKGVSGFIKVALCISVRQTN